MSSPGLLWGLWKQDGGLFRVAVTITEILVTPSLSPSDLNVNFQGEKIFHLCISQL
jgi:hypothetical protein